MYIISRRDTVYPAGGLPALLGRGPTQALRPDQGGGLRLPLPGVGHRHARGIAIYRIHYCTFTRLSLSPY